MIRWLVNQFKRDWNNAARNNRLREAAPDMLNALRWLVSAIEDPRGPQDMGFALGAAKDAIAKATHPLTPHRSTDDGE